MTRLLSFFSRTKTATPVIGASWLKTPEIQQIFAAFAAENHQLWVVGGAVRDAILGQFHADAADVDMATSATPQQMMEFLPRYNIRPLPTGVEHGTVTAMLASKAFQITSLRSDIRCDGRHAEVTFGQSLEEDAKRRDFTINALYMAPDGTVLDPLGIGLSDLKKHRLRFVGDPSERVKEDALRMLRFFRFWSRFSDHAPDTAALRAIKRQKDSIYILSGERIRDEMRRILLSPKPVATLDWMEATKLWQPVFGVKKLRLERLSLMLGQPQAPADWLLRATSVLPFSPDIASWLADRWKLSRDERDQLLFWLSPLPAARPDEAEIKKLLRRHPRQSVMGRLWLMRLAGWVSTPSFTPLLALAESWTPPAFPISGKDLLKQGFTQGTELGEALQHLEHLWEASDYQLTKAELLAQQR